MSLYKKEEFEERQTYKESARLCCHKLKNYLNQSERQVNKSFFSSFLETTHLQNCETVNLYCLSHPVCGILLQQ
jgi:hypothetical protein